ncbi:hypothetical protein QJQ45_014417, partial [Haematococcus lacustris]
VRAGTSQLLTQARTPWTALQGGRQQGGPLSGKAQEVVAQQGGAQHAMAHHQGALQAVMQQEGPHQLGEAVVEMHLAPNRAVQAPTRAGSGLALAQHVEQEQLSLVSEPQHHAGRQVEGVQQSGLGLRCQPHGTGSELQRAAKSYLEPGLRSGQQQQQQERQQQLCCSQPRQHQCPEQDCGAQQQQQQQQQQLHQTQQQQAQQHDQGYQSTRQCGGSSGVAVGCSAADASGSPSHSAPGSRQHPLRHVAHTHTYTQGCGQAGTQAGRAHHVGQGNTTLLTALSDSSPGLTPGPAPEALLASLQGTTPGHSPGHPLGQGCNHDPDPGHGPGPASAYPPHCKGGLTATRLDLEGWPEGGSHTGHSQSHTVTHSHLAPGHSTCMPDLHLLCGNTSHSNDSSGHTELLFDSVKEDRFMAQAVLHDVWAGRRAAAAGQPPPQPPNPPIPPPPMPTPAQTPLSPRHSHLLEVRPLPAPYHPASPSPCSLRPLPEGSPPANPNQGKEQASMVLNASQASTAKGASGVTDPDPLLAVLRLVAVMRRRPGHVGPAAGEGGAKPAETLPCEGPPNITCLQPDLQRGQRQRLQSQQGCVPTVCGSAAAPHLLCQHSGPRGSRRVGGWPEGPVAEGLEPAASSSPGGPAVRSSAVDEWNNDAALPVDISNHVRWSMERKRSAHGGMHGNVDGRVHATCLQSDLAVAARLQPAAAKDTTQLPQAPLPAPQGPPHELIPPASAATPAYLQSSSMFVLGPTNRMRLWTVAITEDRMFSNFILLVICGSALNLALELPKLPLEHPYMRRLNIVGDHCAAWGHERVDWVFTCIFALEMALKLVAKGVVGHPGAYFRTPWDVFDGVIVVTSLVALSGVQAQATVLRSLRLLRLLRPLRLLRKWRGMQLVVETLIQSIPSVSNVLLFGIFLMGIFAILGVQLFAGRMSRCNQAVVEGVTVAWRDECTPGVFICQEADLCSTGEEVRYSSCPHCLALHLSRSPSPAWFVDSAGCVPAVHWSRPFRNFDNIGNAMLTLFTLATLDAFMALAQQCIDTVGVDNQPKSHSCAVVVVTAVVVVVAQEKNAPWMGLYVLSFVFLGSWFWVNLLVASSLIVAGPPWRALWAAAPHMQVSVVVQFYSKLVVEKGDVLVSKQAKEYVKLFRLTNKADYWKGVPVPSNRWRARALRIVAHPYFDRVTIAVVVTNVIIMGCDHYNETDEFSLAMTGLNFGFTSCFVVEMVLKLMALGWAPYLSDNWNRLDCFVILVSIPDLVSSLVPALSNLGFMTIFRVFRVARAFKLINKAKGLRTLFNTLISSSPAIANVGSLLFLLMWVKD